MHSCHIHVGERVAEHAVVGVSGPVDCATGGSHAGREELAESARLFALSRPERATGPARNAAVSDLDVRYREAALVGTS